MKRPATLAVVLIVLGGIALSAFADKDQEAVGPDPGQLVGTWKLVSAMYNGQDFNFPAGLTMLKHVTPEQFLWVRYDDKGQITAAAGGPHEIKGDTYTESPAYGTGADFEAIKGRAHPFQWKVEGTKWHHQGKLIDGLTIEEIWERVEKG
jgi:hypothetical protein